MSSFSSGQLNQLGDKLEAAGWSPEDVTNLGQASIQRLTEIRVSLVPQRDIVAVIEAGQTKLRLAPGQDVDWVQGREILTHLIMKGLLASCADLADLKVIQAKGVDFFRKHFAGKVVFGWRGMQDDFVPFLCVYGGEVLLDWGHVGRNWYSNDPALCRK